MVVEGGTSGANSNNNTSDLTISQCGLITALQITRAFKEQTVVVTRKAALEHEHQVSSISEYSSTESTNF